MEAPKIQTAIPQRRYQLGEYSGVVLGEIESSDGVKYRYILALVREGEGVAARVLENMNVELPKVRTAVEFIIGRGDRPVVGEVGLTPRAKRVIELAIDEARRLGHN